VKQATPTRSLASGPEKRFDPRMSQAGCCALLMIQLFVVGMINLWVASPSLFVPIEKVLPA